MAKNISKLMKVRKAAGSGGVSVRFEGEAVKSVHVTKASKSEDVTQDYIQKFHSISQSKLQETVSKVGKVVERILPDAKNKKMKPLLAKVGQTKVKPLDFPDEEGSLESFGRDPHRAKRFLDHLDPFFKSDIYKKEGLENFLEKFLGEYSGSSLDIDQMIGEIHDELKKVFIKKCRAEWLQMPEGDRPTFDEKFVTQKWRKFKGVRGFESLYKQIENHVEEMCNKPVPLAPGLDEASVRQNVAVFWNRINVKLDGQDKSPLENCGHAKDQLATAGYDDLQKTYLRPSAMGYNGIIRREFPEVELKAYFGDDFLKHLPWKKDSAAFDTLGCAEVRGYSLSEKELELLVRKTLKVDKHSNFLENFLQAEHKVLETFGGRLPVYDLFQGKRVDSPYDIQKCLLEWQRKHKIDHKDAQAIGSLMWNPGKAVPVPPAPLATKSLQPKILKGDLSGVGIGADSEYTWNQAPKNGRHSFKKDFSVSAFPQYQTVLGSTWKPFKGPDGKDTIALTKTQYDQLIAGVQAAPPVTPTGTATITKSGKGGELINFPSGRKVVKFVGSSQKETILGKNVGLFSNYFSGVSDSSSGAKPKLTIQIGGQSYVCQTVEQYFHIRKCLALGAIGSAQIIARLQGSDEKVSNEARQITGRTGSMGKNPGDQVISKMQYGVWDKASSEAMLAGLIQKFQPGNQMSNDLLSLGDKIVLVENTLVQSYGESGDKEIWGNGKDDMGRNRLGIALMVIKGATKSGSTPLDPKNLAQICEQIENKLRPTQTGHPWSSEKQHEIISNAMNRLFPAGW